MFDMHVKGRGGHIVARAIFIDLDISAGTLINTDH
jgi:hypothetical protein